MSRCIAILILLVVTTTSLASASSTWVLWGIKKTMIQETEKGKLGVWSYIDAFYAKNDCAIRKEALSQNHEDYRYECIPVEMNPKDLVFY